MNPRIASRTLLPTASLWLLGIASAFGKSEKVRIIWQENPACCATIGWDQVSGDDAVVLYGRYVHGVATLDQQAAVQREELYMGMRNQFVHLKDLAPNCRYAVLIRDSEGNTQPFWFRTAPAEPRPFTFVAGGDTKTYPEGRIRYRRTNRYVPKLRPLFVVFAGDLTTSGFDGPEWQEWLADWSEDTRTPDGRLFPIVPVRGNHEPDSEILHKLFGLHDARNYFAFDVAGELLRVYVLNSEINIEKDRQGVSRTDLTPELLEQTTWLQRDLEQHRGARFKLASYHKPFRPHTKGKAENDYLYDLWAQLFYDYGVSLTVEGDSHMHKITYPVRPFQGPGSSEGYIRDDARGTMFLGEGSWGAGVRDADDEKPWTLQIGSFAQFKWVQVYCNHMEIRTVMTEEPAGWEANSESNVFAVPSDLRLFAPPGQPDTIRFPYKQPGTPHVSR